MSLILHMSDLHLGRDELKEKENLDILAVYLKEERKSIKYLVFTGDLIDATVIRDKLYDALEKEDPSYVTAPGMGKIGREELLDYIRTQSDAVTDFYNCKLKEITLEETNKAAAVFKEFIKKLGIDDQNVILCCGNHDRIRFADEKIDFCDGRGSTFSEDDTDANDAFIAYSEICRQINDRISYHTEVYKRGNELRFLILNTNWEAKEEGKFCVSCPAIKEKLEEVEGDPSLDTIVVAHKPYDDLCETFKHIYSDATTSTRDKLERLSIAYLCGDKHTFYTKASGSQYEFMCGAPISLDSGVHYNLIEYERGQGIKSRQYLVNGNKKWTLMPIESCREDLWNLCKDYLKGFANEILWKRKEPVNDGATLLELMNNPETADRLQYASQMFYVISELKQGTVPISLNRDQYIDELIDRVMNSGFQSIGLKGDPSRGKSTLLSLIYYRMFERLFSGTLNFLPIYFNMEKVTNDWKKEDVNHTDVVAYSEYCVRAFEDYLTKARDKLATNGVPVCLLLDGLQGENILTAENITIEKRIIEIINRSLDKEYDHFLAAIHTYERYGFPSSFDTINRFEYVLYVDNLRVLPYKDHEIEMEQFLSAYFKLHGISDAEIDKRCEIYKKNLPKYRRTAVGLSFFHYFDDEVMGISDKDKDADVIKRHMSALAERSEKTYGEPYPERIIDAAGCLFSQRLCYSKQVEHLSASVQKGEKPENGKSEGDNHEGKDTAPSITIDQFIALLESDELCNYYIAYSYKEKLASACRKRSKWELKHLLLRSFIPHDISLYVRYMQEQSYTDTLQNFEALVELMEEVNNNEGKFLFSNVLYLIGHLKPQHAKQLLKKVKLPEQRPTTFFEFCYKRSYDYALVSSRNTGGQALQVVQSMIEDPEYRQFNRSYQLYYYGDIQIQESAYSDWATNENNANQSGFSFWNCYLLMMSRITNDIKHHEFKNGIELDLLTLIDLTYLRLMGPVERGVFYDQHYNSDESNSYGLHILKSLAGAIKEYRVESRGGSRNARVEIFFDSTCDELNQIADQLKKNLGRTVTEPYVHHALELNKLLQIETQARVGWNIDKSGSVGKEDYPAFDEKKGIVTGGIKETIAEFILESLYIAQLFLPERIQNVPEYNKNQVIYYILLSEIGRSVTGDYSPHYSEFEIYRKKEENALNHFLSLSVKDGYAYQSEYFTPTSIAQSEEINKKICNEIKLIQCEYKYYTLYDQLNFDDERRNEFEKDFIKPSTEICATIRENLITKNPEFTDRIKESEERRKR